MDANKNKERDEVFSQSVKAGKRTYFFDVKETKNGERYLTVTESKKCFDEAKGNFFYEKHKIFLYNEDMDKFVNGLQAAIHFIKTGEKLTVEDSAEETQAEEKDILDTINFDLF